MISRDPNLPEVLAHSPVRLRFGSGKLAEVGEVVQEIGAQRVLVVTDPGIVAAGYADRAVESLRAAGVDAIVFDGARENPTTEHVARGVAFCDGRRIDLIVGLGGGSAMDCAKGINLILTNGGEIRDYWGLEKPTEPMLPMVAVPTTAGTGSEAQSFALIADATTHQKMACGDRRPPSEGGLRPRVAILDPDLLTSVPRDVTAATGMDAIAHAVETAGCTVRTELSQQLSREAWVRLDRSFESLLCGAGDCSTRADMLLGAHLAGGAIEQSMLGAAHACANPLTARFGIVHGAAVGMMLPRVVRYNAQRSGTNPYALLYDEAEALAERVDALLRFAKLPTNLTACHVLEEDLAVLAVEAANQWTARYNPVTVGEAELLEVYRCAM